MDDFPLDSDGMALKRLVESGLDMSQGVEFEFFIHVENQQQATNIYKALEEKKIGDKIETEYDEGELENGEIMTEENQEFWPSWTVYVYYKMVPDYNKIIAFQETLDKISNPLGGKSDGWGVCID